MEKKKKIAIIVVIITLITLLIIFSPNLIKRLTGEVSNADNNAEEEVINNEFINEVCNISVDNENFMTIEGTIIMDEGEEGTATINVRSGDLVFTKEVKVKSNDYSPFTYILPRGEYSLTITKDGYKTYETNVSESKELNITLVANKNKGIIASGKTIYNTYYDYYSDGVIHLKTVGLLDINEDMYSGDYFYTVLGDMMIKYLASKGYDAKPVSQGGEYDEVGLLFTSILYSQFFGAEIEDVNYRNKLIEVNNKIDSGLCTKDNYMDDENCNDVEEILGFFSALTFEEQKEVLKLILEIPLPTKLIIDDDVVALPTLSGITADEVTIGKNAAMAHLFCFMAAKIGTLTINSPYLGNFDTFARMAKINNLVIGDGVVEIPSGAFESASINNISLPNTLKVIGNSAFESSEISAISLPNSVTEIGDEAFYNCNISDISLPQSLITIGDRAFENNSITSINFPKSLTSIGDSAFKNNKLVSISVPNTITSIKYSAFSNNDLNEIYWDANGINYSPFYDNRAESVKLTIGPNVKVVSNKFEGLKLTELYLSYGVNEIKESAFKNKYLTTVVLPNSVTTIGYSAFENNKITSITIPKNVTNIGYNAFYGNNLESIYYRATNLKTVGSPVFSNNNSDSCNLIIESGVKVIPKRLFEGAKITSVEIPDSVTEIGLGAFSSNRLTELPHIPKGIKTIGSSWFSNNKLTNVVIPYGIETIDTNAFKNNQIESLVIPNSIKTINDSAFSNNNITSITIPENVTNLGYAAFSSNNLETINFKTTKLKTIEHYCFENNKLTNVVIPDGIETIDSGAFINNQIESLIIPNSVTIIYNDAFKGNELTEITIPESVKEIRSGAFIANPLTKITIMGTKTRFNKDWTYIGFPENLMPR